MIKALISLGALPARESVNQQIEKASYYIALEGVTRYGLSEAVRAILKGALSHAFFPSPPELRMQCDKAMEWHERYREKQLREERYLRERRENNVVTTRTPEAIAHQQETYRRFLAGYEDRQKAADEAERAEIRARYGMTDEVVASIADQPIPSNFKKLA
ncbi:MAG: hypothetical protein ACTHKQ_00945 [Mesorhizobium sp.]